MKFNTFAASSLRAATKKYSTQHIVPPSNTQQPHQIKMEPKTPSGLHMQNIKMMIAGIGGAGCNIVDNMIQQGKHFHGVEFLSINTDVQALEQTRNLR